MENLMPNLTERAKAFREAIETHIKKESHKKATKSSTPDDIAKFEYNTWLSRTARIASNIQLTTHPIKATFPDIHIKDASSPLFLTNELRKLNEVGSHLLEKDIIDGTGDAAALSAARFLYQVIFEEMPLIHWVLMEDSDLSLALGEKGNELIDRFKKAWRKNEAPKSHAMAKQIYWLAKEDPTEDDSYHLLQPLFSSSLAQAIHNNIQKVRFREDNKEARKAWRQNTPHDLPYQEYRNLAVRKLGGTKPQNISQLNIERGGINYLLSSLPPKWNRENRIRVMKANSALDSFQWFEDVRDLLNSLVDLLRSNPAPIKDVRKAREELEQALFHRLTLFAEAIRSTQEPGWTRSSDCLLPLCEKLWLDPERTQIPIRETNQEEDTNFNSDYHQGDWIDDVARRFANWLNSRLYESGLTTVGDIEYKHWARQALVETDWIASTQRYKAGDNT